MIVFLIIGGILLFLFLLTLIPIRLDIGFREEFSLTARYLFLSFPILPGREQPETSEETEEEADEGGTLAGKLKNIFHNQGFFGFLKSLFELVKVLETSSRRLLSHVKLKRFDLYLLLAGAGDAAEAAILYGEVSTAAYSACGFLFGLMPCRKKAVTVDLDYKGEDNAVDFSARVAVKPLFAIREGLSLLIQGMPLLKKFKGTNTEPKERISQTRKQGEQHE